MADERPWPSELRLSKDRRLLTVTFEDGRKHELSAEYLRVMSPSAEVQGHSPEQRQTVPGKKDVGIMSLDQVGNYAVRITFDDMHATGLYSWDYLYALGTDRERLWNRYLEELREKGLSRERA